MYSTPPLGKHKVLSTISEDEECIGSDILAMPATDESDQQPDEVALRTRVRRGTTEGLISTLHSLKPSAVSDNRTVEVGILHEVISIMWLVVFYSFYMQNFTKETLKTTLRNLLLNISRVGQQSDARFL